MKDFKNIYSEDKVLVTKPSTTIDTKWKLRVVLEKIKDLRYDGSIPDLAGSITLKKLVIHKEKQGPMAFLRSIRVNLKVRKD